MKLGTAQIWGRSFNPRSQSASMIPKPIFGNSSGLSHGVQSQASDGRLAIDDSKAVYQGPGGFARLEEAVWRFSPRLRLCPSAIGSPRPV